MTVRVYCGVCGAPREEIFATDGDPTEGEHERMHLGMQAPSEVITARQFAAELDRLLPLVGDPTTLSGAQHRASGEAAWEAVTAAYELEKFPEAAIILPKVWPQSGSKRETMAARRAELVALAEKHLEERPAGMERGLAAAKALATPASAYPPSSAFRLAINAGALAAARDIEALLAKLAADPAAISPDKLPPAATFKPKAMDSWRTSLIEKVELELAAAKASGVHIPAPPPNADGWHAWRDALLAASKARVNQLGVKALEAAAAAFDLARGRWSLELIAHIRASSPEHPLLESEATRAMKASELARLRLFDALELFVVFPELAAPRMALPFWADRQAYGAARRRASLDNLAFAAYAKSNEELREIFAKIADNLPL